MSYLLTNTDFDPDLIEASMGASPQLMDDYNDFPIMSINTSGYPELGARIQQFQQRLANRKIDVTQLQADNSKLRQLLARSVAGLRLMKSKTKSGFQAAAQVGLRTADQLESAQNLDNVAATFVEDTSVVGLKIHEVEIRVVGDQGAVARITDVKLNGQGILTTPFTLTAGTPAYSMFLYHPDGWLNPQSSKMRVDFAGAGSGLCNFRVEVYYRHIPSQGGSMAAVNLGD